VIWRLPDIGAFQFGSMIRSMTTRQAALERGTVLIAEDDPQDLFFTKRAFRKAGLENHLACVCDGSEAIAYLAGQGRFADRSIYPLPIVLLLDLRMPSVSGYDVLKWKAQQPQLDGLFTAVVTSMRDLVYVERAYELGAKAFLVKPVHMLDLQEMMERFKRSWLQEPALFPVKSVAQEMPRAH
jgi:CheY-like chemotaxis protein